jgi:hypothetical protein
MYPSDFPTLASGKGPGLRSIREGHTTAGNEDTLFPFIGLVIDVTNLEDGNLVLFFLGTLPGYWAFFREFLVLVLGVHLAAISIWSKKKMAGRFLVRPFCVAGY